MNKVQREGLRAVEPQHADILHLLHRCAALFPEFEICNVATSVLNSIEKVALR